MSTLEYLDDSDRSLDPEDEPTHLLAISIVLLVIGLLGMAAWAFDKWTRPPVISFPAPTTPMFVVSKPVDAASAINSYNAGLEAAGFGGHWMSRCLLVDGARHIIQPNYESKFCSAEEAKERGWWSGEISDAH